MPGSGIKKGQKHAKTIEKEVERERLRQIVVPHLERMTAAQIEHSCGVSYMVLRMPDGTYARATDVKQIDTACAVGAKAFQIFTQAPSTQAYADLLNRALDKPKEQVQDINLNVDLDDKILAILQAGRSKLAKSRG